MRRSAMIEEIVKALRVEYEMADEHRDYAEVALKTVETFGMLPPQRDADLKSSYGYAQKWTWNEEESV